MTIVQQLDRAKFRSACLASQLACCASLGAALLSSPATAAEESTGRCEQLLKLQLPETRIRTAESRPAGDFQPPGAEDARPIANLPAFCRVAGTIAPEINFEVWLPTTNWNGKLYMTAGGGYAGSIQYRGLADGLERQYASVSTDQGHVADPKKTGAAGADWVVGHPERVEAYSYRGIHESTVKAKAVTQAFYATAPKHAYLRGCSAGGRAALVEASRFPEDYDGIIAGAPSDKTIHVWSRLMQMGKALFKDEASRVTPAQLPVLRNAILAACDANDGVVDGVLEDPRQCDFKIEKLQCQDSNSKECYSAAQITALKAAYSGLYDAKGKLLIPGPPVGADMSGGLQRAFFGGPEPWTFALGFFKYWVYENPEWDYHSYDPVASTELADRKYAQQINAHSDLRAFKARGGKLLMYHGWSDEGIPAENTLNYYHDVIGVVTGKPVKGDVPADTTDFMRLFMVPGMSHCGGGYGPNVFDPVPALEQWVENRKAPERIIASRMNAATNTVERTRPLCAYPQVAVYSGSGSTDEATNFSCATPALRKARASN